MAQNIKLKILGTEYPMAVTSEEMEYAMRTAADEINKKYDTYDSKYPGKPQLDKLVLVTLNETVNRIACQMKMEALGTEASSLKDEIESYLKAVAPQV